MTTTTTPTPAPPTTRVQRAAAFKESQAILALESMIEPAGYAQIRQRVIDGTLSIPDAIEHLVQQLKHKN
jgi:hypothetical protein